MFPREEKAFPERVGEAARYFPQKPNPCGPDDEGPKEKE